MKDKKEKVTCGCCDKEEELMFIHSACCGAHWEMILNTKTGKTILECEKCGELCTGVEVKLVRGKPVKKKY